MISRLLLTRFAEWRRNEQPLVLATVVATQGSTYRKPGAQMLLTADGDFEGLLSGGCLEGDLLEHAREVLAQGAARRVSYDFSNPEEDELWGLGLGCLGVTDVLLQALHPSQGYLPFAAVAELAQASSAGMQLLVVASTRADVPPGAGVVQGGSLRRVHGLSPSLAEELLTLAAGAPAGQVLRVDTAGQLEVLVLPVRAPLRLLILGGGPDALPIHRLAQSLGWECSIYDHRPAYAERLRAQGVDGVHELAPGREVPADELARASAAVVMSHHLTSDERYLRALADSPVPYVGLLGPAARRARLLDSLGPAARRLEGRLRAPVGLDLGGEGPEAIALAIVAQVHAMLHGRNGEPLCGAVTGGG